MSEHASAAPAESFDFQLYRYTPSLPAAIVSVAVFAILTSLHIWRLVRVKAFYFTPFVIGGVCTCSLALWKCRLNSETLIKTVCTSPDRRLLRPDMEPF